MNIPNIPSDNLYKFISLSSLAVIIIANIYLYSVRSQILDELFNQRIEMEKSKTDVKLLRIDVDELLFNLEFELRRLIGEEHLELIDTSLSTDERVEYLFELSDSLDLVQEDERSSLRSKYGKEVFKLKKIATQYENAGKILEINEYKISLDESEIKQLYTFYLIVSPIFIISLVIGFVLWYRRIQRYQDILLKNQAEQSQSGKIDEDKKS